MCVVVPSLSFFLYSYLSSSYGVCTVHSTAVMSFTWAKNDLPPVQEYLTPVDCVHSVCVCDECRMVDTINHVNDFTQTHAWAHTHTHPYKIIRAIFFLCPQYFPNVQ